MEPRWRVWSPRVDGWLEPGCIVQTSRLDGNVTGRNLTLGEKRGTAFRTESAIRPAPGFAHDAMIFWMPSYQTQSRFVKQRDSNESAAACALAVPAMAIEHCERCLDALITYDATSAPALKWNRNRRCEHLSTRAMSDGPSRTQRTLLYLRFASLFAPLRKSNVSGPNGSTEKQMSLTPIAI